MDTPELGDSISIYRIIGIIVAFIIIASVLSYCKDLFLNFWNTANFWQSGSPHRHEDETRSGPMNINDQAVSPDSSVASSDQTWCFLGEDMVGRWCVQVSSPSMCPTDRSFASKNRCEGRSGQS